MTSDFESANPSLLGLIWKMLRYPDYIDDVVDDPETKHDKSKMASLEEFGRYGDVIAAFQIFCVAEMPPVS